jgi:hypothetical protein
MLVPVSFFPLTSFLPTILLSMGHLVPPTVLKLLLPFPETLPR